MCGESPASAGGSKLPLHSKITLLPFGRDVFYATVTSLTLLWLGIASELSLLSLYATVTSLTLLWLGIASELPLLSLYATVLKFSFFEAVEKKQSDIA